MPEGVGYASSNVVAGAGLDLNYVADRVFAYSGLHAASTAQSGLQVLSFTTGNKVIVGEMQLNAEVDDDDPTLGGASTLMISINGIKVSLLKADGELERAPSSQTQRLVFPPYTVVECILDSGQGGGDHYASVTFVGKVL